MPTKKKKPVPRGRNGGRPARTAEPASRRISVGVTEAEHAAITRACDDLGWSLAQAVRALPRLLSFVG